MLPKADKLNPQILDAFSRVQDQSAFREVTVWLQAELARQRRTNDAQPDVVLLRWGQGAAITLQALLDVVHDAPSALKRLRHASR